AALAATTQAASTAQAAVAAAGQMGAQTLAYATIVQWPASLNTVTRLMLTGNAVMATPTGQQVGFYYLTVDRAVTNQTLTWSADFHWPGGTPPAASTGAGMIDTYTFRSDGQKMYFYSLVPGIPVTAADAVVITPGALSLWYDPFDLSALYQDATGMTAVTAAGQSLGRMVDKDSGIHWMQSTADARPLLADAPLSVVFDGNDALAAEAFAVGTLGANMDIFIPMKRNTNSKIVTLYDNAADGECYVGTMSTVNGTVDLGSGAPTYAVNGNSLTAATRPAIEAAMGTGRWSLLEIRNANLSAWRGIGIGGYNGFALNGALGPVRVLPAQTDAARTSIRNSIMTTYGITVAPVAAPAAPAQGDFYNTRVQNLLPMQKQIRGIYYEVYFGHTNQYTVNDIDTRLNEWYLFTAQPKVPAGWGTASKDNYGDGTFDMPNIGEANLSNDKLLAAHNRGVRLVLSIGGAQAGFNIDTNARRQKLLDSIISMITRLSAGSGVGNIISGVSWNTFEAYLRSIYANNPANCTANTANIVWISQQLAALYGPNFSFHMPPSSSFSFSPYDIIVARAMKASGLPFVAAPQNYDDDYSTKTPGVVSTNNKQWAADIGQDATMIGLACGFKGSYAKAMTMPFMQTELDNYLATYPYIRGFFLWSQHDKINADMPAWMTYVISKIPGKL
ncbi:MAG: chitinase, Glycoside Hydrolase Family 18-like protein, partial [Polaromonas sp.]|nr:chitinase, Glycoside Hydrolase Family 18-like protein [Polaromonas sp.]